MTRSLLALVSKIAVYWYIARHANLSPAEAKFLWYGVHFFYWTHARRSYQKTCARGTCLRVLPQLRPHVAIKHRLLGKKWAVLTSCASCEETLPNVQTIDPPYYQRVNDKTDWSAVPARLHQQLCGKVISLHQQLCGNIITVFNIIDWHNTQS